MVPESRGVAERDDEAYRLIAGRRFSDCALVELSLDMATRRLTIAVYGALSGGSVTQVGTMTFFGADNLLVEGETGSFPRSAQLSTVGIEYDGETGGAAFIGQRGWRLSFAFDGVQYAEHPAVIASLIDESDVEDEP